MTNLPKIQANSQLIQAVNARELHAYLQINSKFADWIKNRIADYDFFENQDFITFSKNLESGGRVIEYAISIDMAKELAMVENNEQGKTARKYFIECEKQLKAQPKLPSNYIEALESLLESEKQKQVLQLELKNAQPKINHYDKVVERQNLVNATQVGAKLGGMSAIKLNKHLTELGVYNQSVKRGKVFNTWFEQKGYGEMKQTELGFDQPLFTQKGQAWIIEQLTVEGVA